MAESKFDAKTLCLAIAPGLAFGAVGIWVTQGQATWVVSNHWLAPLLFGAALAWAVSVWQWNRLRQISAEWLIAVAFVGIIGIGELYRSSSRNVSGSPPVRRELNFSAFVQKSVYPSGVPLAGIVWADPYVDLRLDISTAVDVQDLDVLISLDTSIVGIGQLTQFPGVVAFPSGNLPAIWLTGRDKDAKPIMIPAPPIPGGVVGAQEYRLHCAKLFKNTVTQLVVASVAINHPSSGRPPQRLFATRRPPRHIRIDGSLKDDRSRVHAVHYQRDLDDNQ